MRASKLLKYWFQLQKLSLTMLIPLTGIKKIACSSFCAVERFRCRGIDGYFSSLLGRLTAFYLCRSQLNIDLYFSRGINESPESVYWSWSPLPKADRQIQSRLWSVPSSAIAAIASGRDSPSNACTGEKLTVDRPRKTVASVSNIWCRHSRGPDCSHV